MTFDTNLLKRAIEQIELHPEQHVQTDWRCATGQCLAGWVGIVDGAPWQDEKDHYNDNVIDKNGEVVHVADYAEAALGSDFIDNLTEEEFYTIYGPEGRPYEVYVEETGTWKTTHQSYAEAGGNVSNGGIYFGLFGGHNTRSQLRGALSVIEARQAQK